MDRGGRSERVGAGRAGEGAGRGAGGARRKDTGKGGGGEHEETLGRSGEQEDELEVEMALEKYWEKAEPEVPTSSSVSHSSVSF